MPKGQSKLKELRNWLIQGSRSSHGTTPTSFIEEPALSHSHDHDSQSKPTITHVSNIQPPTSTVVTHPITPTLQPPTTHVDHPQIILGPSVLVETHPRDNSVTPTPQPVTAVALSPAIFAYSPHFSSFEDAHDLTVDNSNFINTAGNTYMTVNTYANVSGPTSYSAAGKATLIQNIAKTAFYDSGAKMNPPQCDPGSRLSAIQEITDWIMDEGKPSGILCMTGSAGIGKSAVKRTVAEQLAKNHLLAASFFFAADDPLRNNRTRFIPTIAYQLAQYDKRMEPFLYQAVEEDLFIFDRLMEKQAEVLIVQPFLQSHTPSTERRLYPVIIDGLDECEDQTTQTEILRVLRFLVSQQLPFKFCISSRPEHPIRSALQDFRILGGFAHHIDLKNHDATNDIRGHLIRNLRAIAETSRDPRITRVLWPSDEEIEQLVQNASGHFIYAATVVKFIDEPHRPPYDRLHDILSWTPGIQQPENPFELLDSLYTHILEFAQTNLNKFVKDPLAVVRIFQKIRLYGTVLSDWSSEISVSEFEILLQLDPSSLSHMLCDLHSLINAGPATSPSTFIKNITHHHKSFVDFLVDPNRNKKYYISDEDVSAELAGHCLDLFRTTAESDFLELLQHRDEGVFHSGLALHSAFCRWPILLQHSVYTGSSQSPSPSLLRSLSHFTSSGSWKKMTSIVKVDPWLCRPSYISSNDSVVKGWAEHLTKFVEMCSPTVKTLPEWQVHFNEIETLVSLINELRPQWPERHDPKRSKREVP